MEREIIILTLSLVNALFCLYSSSGGEGVYVLIN